MVGPTFFPTVVIAGPMAVAMSPAVLPFLAAGLVLLALAVWLVRLDDGSRVNRAFAVFLGVRGVLGIALALFHNRAIAAPEGWLLTVTGWAEAVVPALHIAVPFVAVYFGFVYRDTYVRDQDTRLPTTVLLGLLALFELAYLLEPGLWRSGGQPGPLFMFSGLTYLSYALIALLLGWEATRVDPPVARSFLLIAMAFSLSPLHLAVFEVSAFDVGLVLLRGAGDALTSLGPFFVASHLLVVLSLIPLGLLVGRWMAWLLDDEGPARGGVIARLLLTMGVPVVTGLVAAWAFLGGEGAGQLSLPSVFEGLWDTVLPLVVAYTLLRHQLFGLDLKLKGALEHSTLAGIVGAGFLVVSEGLELVIPVSGDVLSFLSAAAIGLLLHPIQRVAERATTAILPDVQAPEEMARQQRLDAFREQLTIAWADGDLTAKEQRMLEAVRQRLDLPERDAERLEAEVRAQIDADGTSPEGAGLDHPL